MKKIISLISILVTIIALIFCVNIYSNFSKIGYVEFVQNKVKTFSNGNVFPGDPTMEFNVQLLIENKSELPVLISELEYRGDIIEASLNALYLVLGMLILLFLINIYLLVISFQDRKK